MKVRLPLLIVAGVLVSACGATATSPNPTDIEPSEGAPTTAATGSSGVVVVPDHLRTMQAAWDTDFGKTTIDLNELLVGIPSADPRDAIRPIDEPVFESVSDTEWLADREPGVLLEIDGDARFYPLSILTRHEIVNDEFGVVPVAVTYCPLCNTAVTFDRRFEDVVLRLGVSGLLRNSDLVMWDNETHSLWQQITGEAIVGEYAGAQLEVLGSAIVRWADFKVNHPNGAALSSDQGFGSVYGYNPYEFYSSRPTPYGFFTGDIDERYPALERVVGVMLGNADKAYPFSEINDVQVVNDTIGGEPLVVFWGAADTADALDSGDISRGLAIGTGVAYSPVVNGQTLTFVAVGDTEFIDNQTGSTWSILGQATHGELEGSSLELVPHRNEFWFAWQAFFPESDVWTG